MVTTWNYRVLKKAETFAIYEVYYDDDGNIEAFTEAAVYPCGKSLDELRQDLEHFREALDKPLLDYEELSKQVSRSGME